MSKAKIKKYLEVNKTHVYTKENCFIQFNLEDYSSITLLYGEDVGIYDVDNVFQTPGFFSIEFEEHLEKIDFFFPYDVYIHKTDQVEQNSKFIRINFKKGDLVFYANFKNNDSDIIGLKKLFDNGVKYLGDYPDKLITAIWQNISQNSKIPIHHIEVIISQLYGTYDKKSKEYKPLRLTELPYSKKYIFGSLY